MDFIYKNKEEISDDEKNAVLDVAYLRNHLLRQFSVLVGIYYEIGLIFQKNKNKDFFNRLRRIFSLSASQLRFAIGLVELYSSKEKAIEEFETKYNYQINVLFKEIIKKKLLNPVVRRKEHIPLQELFFKLQNFQSLPEEEQKRIYALYQEMKKIFPDKPNLDDRFYLKYSICAFCGEEPGPDGNELINHPELPFVKIPLCKHCYEKGLFDRDLLVKIYAHYALNLENAINKINNIEQE